MKQVELKKDGPLTGEILKDKKGNPLKEPGLFKHVKGIGWFIDEYGIAQISYNLTNINESPLQKCLKKHVKEQQLRYESYRF